MKVDRHGSAAVLSATELDAVLDAAPSARYRALWAIQRWTAARISECLALTWGDVNGMVTYRRSNTKTKTTRQVPMSAQLAAEIAAYRTAWPRSMATPPKGMKPCFRVRAPLTRQ